MLLFLAAFAASFFAGAFFNFAKCAFIEPDLWPGFRAGLLPPVIFFGPGGNIPGSSSGGSPGGRALWVEWGYQTNFSLFLSCLQFGPDDHIDGLLHTHIQAWGGYCKSCFHLAIVVEDIVVDVHLIPSSTYHFSKQGLTKTILDENFFLPLSKVSSDSLCRLWL